MNDRVDLRRLFRKSIEATRFIDGNATQIASLWLNSWLGSYERFRAT